MRAIALEYHDIVTSGNWEESGFPGNAAASYKLGADDFERHLEAVSSSGVVVINDVEGHAWTSRRGVGVLWTFDDGGSGYLAHAADRLERRGWRGLVFMTSGCIGKTGFLTGPQLRELRSRGHIIGTHSRTHPVRLATLTADEVSAEWRSSIADLEDVLGSRVLTGSVPGGSYSRRVAVLAAHQGIKTLFTSEPVTRTELVDQCTVVGRFTLRRGDPAAYVGRLVSGFPTARGLQWLHWNVKKAAKRVAGEAYGRLRDRVFGR